MLVVWEVLPSEGLRSVFEIYRNAPRILRDMQSDSSDQKKTDSAEPSGACFWVLGAATGPMREALSVSEPQLPGPSGAAAAKTGRCGEDGQQRRRREQYWFFFS